MNHRIRPTGASEAPRPNFFFVGAPRCGTTSLCKHLAEHPDVCFSIPTEPHYFSRLDRKPTLEELRRDYLETCFGHCDGSHAAVGERSVSYIFAPQAIEMILEFFPEARFIAHVRNPIDFVHSYHARCVFNMDEDVTDFAEAWNLQAARARGERIPRLCRDARLLQYREVARLGTNLLRLHRLAGEQRCHTVLFDDFIADSGESYRQVLAFLGLPDDGRRDMKRKQANKSYRSAWLQRAMYRPPQAVEKVALRMERQGGTGRSILKRLGKQMKLLNVVERPRRPLDDTMRRVLIDALGEEIDILSEFFGRDFSHWKSGTPPVKERSRTAPQSASAGTAVPLVEAGSKAR